MLRIEGSESKFGDLRKKKLYVILLGVFPVVDENVLLSKNCMHGSILGQKIGSSRA